MNSYTSEAFLDIRLTSIIICQYIFIVDPLCSGACSNPTWLSVQQGIDMIKVDFEYYPGVHYIAVNSYTEFSKKIGH